MGWGSVARGCCVALALAGCVEGQNGNPWDDAVPLDTDGAFADAPVAYFEIEESGPIVCQNPWRSGQGNRLRKVALPQEGSRARWYGPGAAVDDFDGDGDLDLFLPQPVRPDRLLLRGKDGRYTDGSDRLPDSARGVHIGAVAAPLDDGASVDLHVIGAGESDEHWHNVDGAFKATSLDLATDEARYGVTLADLNDDGWLDLFIASGNFTGGGFGDLPLALAGEPDDVPPDTPSEPDPNTFWLGGPDGWQDVSEKLPSRLRNLHAFASVAVDLNVDGARDLYVPADFGEWLNPSAALTRDGDRWQEVAESLGLDGRVFGMSAAPLHNNPDGPPSIVVTDVDAVHVYMKTGPKWFDQGSALGLQMPFSEEDVVFGWGVGVADFDNDTHEDVVIAMGRVVGEEANTDPVSPGLKGMIAWRGLGDAFEVAPDDWGLRNDASSRAMLPADLNEDGFVDLVRTSWHNPAEIFMNRCDKSAWMSVKLRQPGPNARALGASVRLTTVSGTQLRTLHAGGASYGSSTAPIAHFGLGDEDEVTQIEVTWPDGTIEVQDGPWASRQHITIVRR